ncbi:carboxymethylenebutenolidase homolog [Impatiens glandulifera]|uniref:carboxymethylenebutenolidase homolog n=1 Tax=Impatiens glandulifera TaxID=253017 RepID=UPI001FB151D8|nr:carboxymethylenebutenolidase homolog [Impatiens glandulifera]
MRTSTVTTTTCNDIFLRNRRQPDLYHYRLRRQLSTVFCFHNHRHHQLLLSRTCTIRIPSSSSSAILTYSACKASSSSSSSNSQIKVEEEDESCELVNGMELSISTDDELDSGSSNVSIRAYFLQAVKNNNGIGILLLSDIFGFEDSSTRDFAYRVACNGYNVLVPDLFRGDPWAKDKPRDLFESWLSKQDTTRVTSDIIASSKWLLDEFEAVGISKKLGLIGFCFGGGRVVDVLARDKGKSFRTGVSFYGTRIDTSVATDVKVPILFIVGDNDPLCPINDLEGIVKKNENGKSLAIFKGRGHGFAHRPQTPEEDDDAEQAFMKMRSWLQNSFAAEET